MIKRYTLTFCGFVLLALIYLLTLVPLLIARGDLTNATYMRALIAWGVLMLASLLPALSLLVQKIWFFHGHGRAVSEKKLRATLLGLNEKHIPLRIKKKGKRLMTEWRYDDPEWCERMAAENVTRLYELTFRFNENTNTVILSDRFRRVDFSLAPVRIKRGLFARPGLLFNIKNRKGTGVEQYTNMLPVDYRFRANEIKSPLANTILSLGWNVQISLL